MNNRQLQLISDYKKRIEPQLEHKYNNLLNERMSEQADSIYPELTIYPKKWDKWVIAALKHESPQSIGLTNDTYFKLFDTLTLDKAAIVANTMKKRTPIEMDMNIGEYREYLEVISNIEKELELLAAPLLEKLKAELLIERENEFNKLVKDAEKQIIGEDLKNGGKRIPLPIHTS